MPPEHPTAFPSDTPLTRPQRKILDAIHFFLRKGEVPTVREVGALVGLRSPATVLKHLRALERAKLVSLSGKSRGIRLTNFLPPEPAPATNQPATNEPPTNEPGGPSADFHPRVFSRPRLVAGNSVAGNSGAGNSGAGNSGAGNSGAENSGAGNSPPRSPTTREAQATKTTRANKAPGIPGTSGTSGISGISGISRTLGIRLVGAIAAGQPFESYPDAFAPDTTPELPFNPEVFVESGDVFALRVNGDSMVDAGILDGDYVIIRRQNTVEEGEIAAVIINGEGTLKRWHTRSSTSHSGQSSRSVHLQPANQRFEPIDIKEEDAKDVLIFGKYVGLVRGNLLNL